MKLIRVKIKGFRSIRKPLELLIDPEVTVVLGANDHGKSNVLAALTHLNPDTPFSADEDLNWDSESTPEDLPYVEFELEFNAADQALLRDAEKQHRLSLLTGEEAESSSNRAQHDDQEVADEDKVDSQDEDENSATTTVEGTEPERADDNAATGAGMLNSEISIPATSPTESSSDTDVSEEAMDALVAELPQAPKTFVCYRQGVDNSLDYDVPAGFDEKVFIDFFSKYRPRVELFQPYQKLSDSVTADSLQSEENEFMRGIFHYALLEPTNADALFTQTDTTSKRLSKASQDLNETLKESWSQGQQLQFELRHNNGEIDLRINDPAVDSRVVRVSRRSSGFTHFFGLKTVLHARQTENAANSYIFLFDEPGIYLHPAGQNDLLRVLDILSQTNQIVYSTHSIFMTNKTFPSRHRLIIKTENGTEIDHKPYVGRWGAVFDALGLSFGGSLLFAESVLLCEGDSEAVLIPPVFQLLMSLGKRSFDLNSFAVLGTGNVADADALIRLLMEGANSPSAGLLVDGDKGGADRLKALKTVLESFQMKPHRLTAGTTIEDHLPAAGILFPEALIRYAEKVLVQSGRSTSTAIEIRTIVESEADTARAELDSGKGMVAFVERAWSAIPGSDGRPSKIGLAREYVACLREKPESSFSAMELKRAIQLLDVVAALTKLPMLGEANQAVLDAS